MKEQRSYRQWQKIMAWMLIFTMMFFIDRPLQASAAIDPNQLVKGNITAVDTETWVNNNTEATLSIEAHSMQASEQIPNDIVLIVDQSGSMRGQNITEVKTALTDFVDKIDLTKHRVALLGFDQKVETRLPFTQNIDDIKAKIDSLQAMGATCAYTAIDEATSLLNTDSRSDAVPTMILMTDGEDHYKEKAKDSAKAAKDKGFTFFTVGCYDGSRNEKVEELLKDIATTPSHHYYDSADKLPAHYADISTKIGAN